MNNILFISDIHFQFIIKEKIHLEKDFFKNELLNFFDFWLIKNNNDTDIDLYIGWDFFNYVKFNNTYTWFEKKNSMVSLEFYFQVIKEYLDSNWYILKNCYYIKWNHDYYNNFPKYHSNHRFNFLNPYNHIVDNYITKSFRMAFWDIRCTQLERKPIIDWEKMIVWNMLYSSGIKLDDLKKWWFALNLLWANIFKSLNDCSEFSKIIKKSISNKSHWNYFELSFYNSLTDDLKNLFDTFVVDYNELQNNWYYLYQKNYAKISKFLFLYFYLSLLQDIYRWVADRKAIDIKEIDIITHYPFELLWSKMLFVLENVKIDKLNIEENPFENKEYNNTFIVDNSFLFSLLEYIQTLPFQHFEVINLFCWHTHTPIKIKSCVSEWVFWSIKEINLYNNSIWKINLTTNVK